ncbi:non-homologous end-joining DNA ligase [Actinokineospora auranticolor]|uniref:DNA ligase D-like protein (Predicted polymerase) n=1 Tax=Actinokineospora auranticolor TaxID=155976 RepID=A0A2S6GEH5_9PSEU|nr:non-homologous end-joining DNA ligase [Actinokineospora auranticolor]PPK63610.1 DNA ligase D-like protein (predicted polymerase) [Actinokineospora auranticolor]
MSSDEVRDSVSLTNLDQPLFDDASATKRDLVDYLDAVHTRVLPGLRDRPLSVVRIRPGQGRFMQKNVPKYTPDWVRTETMWAETSKRDISYAVCDDRRTLLWFANQRAVEYHVPLWRLGSPAPTHLVLDLDPPEGADFAAVVAAALLVRQALAADGLAAAVKTSGAKGLHVLVPVAEASMDDMAAATRAVAVRTERLDPALATTAYIIDDRGGKVFLDSTRAYGATLVAAYSPRIRPGTPVSFPVRWGELESVRPGDFTLRTAVERLGDGDPWAESMPEPQVLPEDLVAEGRTIPVARVQAMHEGKRRKAKAARQAEGTE